jgi:hypothetical protein
VCPPVTPYLPPSLPPSSLQVVYEDGDCEELELREVREVLVAAQSVSAEKQELLRGYGRSMTARASPSDFSTSRGIRRGRDTSSGRGSGKKAKKSEEKAKKKSVSPRRSSSSSSKKRPRDEEQQQEEEAHQEEHQEEHQEGEGAHAPKRLTAAGVRGGSYFVLKSFGDLGDFNGLVISHDKPFYKVGEGAVTSWWLCDTPFSSVIIC